MMKRKGFTLVELLIVVAILGVLSATMMIRATGSTANSKAMTIANNVRSCKSAALLYCQINGTGIGKVTATTTAVLTAHVNAWADFKDTGNIHYTVPNTADTATATNEDWAIQVDYHNDTEADNITEKLAKIPGFSKIGSNNNFTINLWDGTVTAGEKITDDDDGGD